MCVLAARNIPLLSPLLNYGKSYRSTRGPFAFLFNLTVPRTAFWHFYATSIVCCMFEVLSYGWSWRRALLLVQSARRLAENWWLFPPSTARMHLAHYLVGHGFYMCEALAGGPANHETSLLFPKLVGLVGFVLASIGQHLCHRTIASTKRYRLPQFFMKDVASPHYLFEVLIYASILCFTPAWPFAFMSVVWAHIILSTSAAQSCKFYNAQGTTVRYSMYPYIM